MMRRVLSDGVLVYATETWSRRSCQVFESVNLPVKLKARSNAALSSRKCECDGACRLCFPQLLPLHSHLSLLLRID
jgi:hypothetical protein